MRKTALHRQYAAERHRLERAIEMYLRHCYRTRTVVRVSELAQYLGVNRTYLSRVAPRALGESLQAALKRRQLAYAERLLLQTLLSIAEIAAATGFGTDRTFFRAFREAFGVTTGEHRRKATKCR